MTKFERIRCMSEKRLLEELGNIAYVYENSINGEELAKYAMKEIVNKMNTLNKLAEEIFGEFGFSTLTEKEQEYIINKLEILLNFTKSL